VGIFDRKDDKKDNSPDFSNVRNSPDFSNVRAGGSSTAPAADQAPATGASRTYVVVSGDSLSKIAKREYGDAQKWPQIYEANRDIIKDPDLIYPGQILRLP
jgi:nucleoid-associated protein YgaU